MTNSFRRLAVLSLSTAALVLAPVALNGAAPSLFGGIAALAGNGNGNGGDNGNGGGNGGGNGNGGGGGGENSNAGGNGGGQSSDTASASGSGNGTGANAGSSSKKKSSDDAIVTADVGEDSPVASGKERSLNAELAGLNSLKRNINGLMNSSDPRMDEIREFIVASAELEGAQAELESATEALNDAKLAYLGLLNDLGVGSYDDVSPAGLQGRLDEVGAQLEDLELTEDELAELTEDEIAAVEEQRGLLETEQTLLQNALATINDSEELADLMKAMDALGDAEDKVAGLEGATDEDALKDALRTAANDNREVTDEVVAWASKQLGIGDNDGLIDDYVATQ